MFTKLKELKDKIVGRVIIKKVAGKFAKHATGALVGLVAAQPIIAEAGVNVDFKTFEAWLAVTLAGLFGAGFNFIQHRFVKK